MVPAVGNAGSWQVATIPIDSPSPSPTLPPSRGRSPTSSPPLASAASPPLPFPLSTGTSDAWLHPASHAPTTVAKALLFIPRDLHPSCPWSCRSDARWLLPLLT